MATRFLCELVCFAAIDSKVGTGIYLYFFTQQKKNMTLYWHSFKKKKKYQYALQLVLFRRQGSFSCLIFARMVCEDDISPQKQSIHNKSTIFYFVGRFGFRVLHRGLLAAEYRTPRLQVLSAGGGDMPPLCFADQSYDIPLSSVKMKPPQ